MRGIVNAGGERRGGAEAGRNVEKRRGNRTSRSRQAEEDGGAEPAGTQSGEDSSTREFERPCLKNQTWRTSQAYRKIDREGVKER